MTLPTNTRQKAILRYIQTHSGKCYYSDIRYAAKANPDSINKVIEMYPDNCRTDGVHSNGWVEWTGYAPYAIRARYEAWLPNTTAPQSYYKYSWYLNVATQIFDRFGPLSMLAGMNYTEVYAKLVESYHPNKSLSKYTVKDICYYCVRFAAHEVDHGHC